jgi:hypothetical protein
MTKTTVQQFSFITPLFSDTCRHTKNKSRRRCRLYFRGRMHCWWIFDFETDYTNILLRKFRLQFLRTTHSTPCYKERLNFENTLYNNIITDIT